MTNYQAISTSSTKIIVDGVTYLAPSEPQVANAVALSAETMREITKLIVDSKNALGTGQETSKNIELTAKLNDIKEIFEIADIF